MHQYYFVGVVATQETIPLLFRPPSRSGARRLLTLTMLYLFPFLIRLSCTGPGLEGQLVFLESLWDKLSAKYRFSRGQKSANVTFKLLRAGFCSHFEILSGKH